MGYAVRNDGKGWRAVSGPADATGDETYSETQPAVVVDPNAAILMQIHVLEASVTPRRLREDALTAEGKAWLADLDAQIAALRAQRV